MANYTRAHHTVYHHRYHIGWITKYRYRVLQGELRLRVREIIAQVADEMGIQIVNGVLSSDHVHIFASIALPIIVSIGYDVIEKVENHEILMGVSWRSFK